VFNCLPVRHKGHIKVKIGVVFTIIQNVGRFQVTRHARWMHSTGQAEICHGRLNRMSAHASAVVEAFFPRPRRGRGRKYFQRGKESWGSLDARRGKAEAISLLGEARQDSKCSRLLVQELSSCRDGRLFGHNRHGSKSGKGLLWGRWVPTGSPSNTMCLGRRLPLYQVASWSIQQFGHNCRNATLIL